MEEGAAYGIAPAGMLALDMARIEAGLLLIDVDYTSSRRAFIEQQKSTPHELSLEWSVALSKEQYEGLKEAIANWRLAQQLLKQMQRLIRQMLFGRLPNPPRRKKLSKKVLGLI